MIDTVLWPYTIQAVVQRKNELSLDENGRSPLERFFGIDNEIVHTYFHAWGYPVYILDTAN